MPTTIYNILNWSSYKDSLRMNSIRQMLSSLFLLLFLKKKKKAQKSIKSYNWKGFRTKLLFRLVIVQVSWMIIMQTCSFFVCLRQFRSFSKNHNSINPLTDFHKLLTIPSSDKFTKISFKAASEGHLLSEELHQISHLHRNITIASTKTSLVRSLWEAVPMSLLTHGYRTIWLSDQVWRE